MDELAKRIAELADKVGPQAMEAARAAVRIEAYSNLMLTVIGVVVACCFIRAARYLWGYKTQDSFDAGIPRFFAGILLVIGVGCSITALWVFIDPWTWTAIYNPDLWLVRKILKL